MFKPIVNTINKTKMKKALIDWIIKKVNIEELYNVIPWNDELESLICWDDVRKSVDYVIDYCDDIITDKPWDIFEVITDTDECVRFNNFIDEKVDNIVKVYDSYIERANKTKQLIAKNAQSVDDMTVNADIAHIVHCILDSMFIREYVETVFDIIIEDVIDDVKETADKQFSDDDVRLAVNRVILKQIFDSDSI